MVEETLVNNKFVSVMDQTYIHTHTHTHTHRNTCISTQKRAPNGLNSFIEVAQRGEESIKGFLLV